MFRHGVTVVLVLLVASPLHALLFQPTGRYREDRSMARRLHARPEYVKLGGRLASSPGCMVRNGHEVHCFYTTGNGTVGYANVQDGKAVHKDFGGNVMDQPQTVEYGSEGVFAFFITSDGVLVVVGVKTMTKYDDKVTVLDDFGEYLEAPGCTTVGSYITLFCVIRSANSGMYVMKFQDNEIGWEKPYYVTDNPNSPLGCDFNGATLKIHCWSTDSNKVLAERIFTEQGFPLLPTWWTQDQRARGRVSIKILGTIPFPRALAYKDNEMIDVFGTFGGDLRSEPDCTNSDSHSLDCFALDEEHGLQRNYQVMGILYVRRTSGWIHYGGDFVGKPSCVYLHASRKINCYMRSDHDELVEGSFKTFDAPGIVVS